MRITSLTLSNFRCFGPKPTTIDLSDLTCFVGTNGSGKTAVLAALTKLFGISNSERMLEKSDFHVPAAKATGADEISLFLEARLDFPELEQDEESTSPGVPESFKQMTVEDVGANPYCRFRLEGQWKASNTPDGDIDQNSYWVTTADGNTDEHKLPVSSSQRSRIHVLYIPAIRDPSDQLRYGKGYLLSRLLRAVNWSKEMGKTISESAEHVSATFDAEGAVKQITKAIRRNWNDLHTLAVYGEPSIRPLSGDLDQVLRNIQIAFAPTAHGAEETVEKLSEGLKSLFYLALVGMNFDIEEELLSAPAESADENNEELLNGAFDSEGEEEEEPSISLERIAPPSLLVLAMEEPENHLSPHYLGRIMGRLRSIAQSNRGQVLITSHSPSIMTRVEPEEVRYLRLDSTQQSVVRNILLPSKKEESYKYVREAVRAYPELYFSALVVLGEGDSEEIVLPRLAHLSNLVVDLSFVSVVPLGGKHVNHFWKLLSDLDIPYITLLDLDRERVGGGWGRIKYVCQQLLRIGVDRDPLLRVSGLSGKSRILSEEELENMHTWDPNSKSVEGWLNRLEGYDVFFSVPLDLDFLMLNSYRDAYEATAVKGGGPSIPEEGSAEYESERKAAVEAVLKAGAAKATTYSGADMKSFFWYRYLFLNRSKPSTHIEALSTMSEKELLDSTPPVLGRVIDRMKKKLT